MTDVIAYSDSEVSLDFATDTEGEYERRFSRSTNPLKFPDENNMKVNQGNYSNKLQMNEW